MATTFEPGSRVWVYNIYGEYPIALGRVERMEGDFVVIRPIIPETGEIEFRTQIFPSDRCTQFHWDSEK